MLGKLGLCADLQMVLRVVFFPVQIKAGCRLADFLDRLGSSENFHGDVSQIKAQVQTCRFFELVLSSSARFYALLAEVGQIKALRGVAGPFSVRTLRKSAK